MLGFLPLFLFHTCNGSGPDVPPFLYFDPAFLGVEAWCPLADLATNRGRGTEEALLTGLGLESEALNLISKYWVRHYDLGEIYRYHPCP